MDNKDDLEELLDRAETEEIESIDSDEDQGEATGSSIVSKVEGNHSDFSGYFHERDRLDHNNIVDEVKTSFMEYSMSVIASRALPDLRDVIIIHMEILLSMRLWSVWHRILINVICLLMVMETLVILKETVQQQCVILNLDLLKFPWSY